MPGFLCLGISLGNIGPAAQTYYKRDAYHMHVPGMLQDRQPTNEYEQSNKVDREPPQMRRNHSKLKISLHHTAVPLRTTTNLFWNLVRISDAGRSEEKKRQLAHEILHKTQLLLDATVLHSYP